MVGYQRDFPRFGICCSPSAQNALIPELFAQVAFDAGRHYPDALQTAHLSCLPLLYIDLILVLALTQVAAVLITRARRLFTAGKTRSPCFARHGHILIIPPKRRPKLKLSTGRILSRWPGSNWRPAPSLTPLFLFIRGLDCIFIPQLKAVDTLVNRSGALYATVLSVAGR